MNKREQGFTLLEVAAALLIISFIFIGILSLMQSTKKLSSENIDQLVMTSFATGSLKRFLDNPYIYLPNASFIKYEESDKKKEQYNTKFRFSNGKIETISSDNVELPSLSYSVENSNLDSQLYQLQANNKIYYLQIELSQDQTKLEQDALDVLVTVSKYEDFSKGQVKVEGILNYEFLQ